MDQKFLGHKILLRTKTARTGRSTPHPPVTLFRLRLRAVPRLSQSSALTPACLRLLSIHKLTDISKMTSLPLLALHHF